MIELIPRYKNKNNFRKEEVKEFSEFIFLGTGGERLMRNLDEQMHLGNFIAAYINMFMLSKPDLRFLLNCLHVATQADASTSRNQSVVSEKKERQVCSELVFMSVNPWALQVTVHRVFAGTSLMVLLTKGLASCKELLQGAVGSPC